MNTHTVSDALDPIVERGALVREFQDAMRSHVGYRGVVDHYNSVSSVGKTSAKTRSGLKPKDALHTGIESYTITPQYMTGPGRIGSISDNGGLIRRVMENAKIAGADAGKTLSGLAGNVLAAACSSGNTYVRQMVGEHKLIVDDIRGFESVFINGSSSEVSAGSPLMIRVGGGIYTCIRATVHPFTIANTPGGRSGELIVLETLYRRHATLMSPVVAATASSIIRPNDHHTSALMDHKCILTTNLLLNATMRLRQNVVPEFHGTYKCYIDLTGMQQLFSDHDFREMFPGCRTMEDIFYEKAVSTFLGVHFVPITRTNERPNPTVNGQIIRQVMVCGRGALVEESSAGNVIDDVILDNRYLKYIDGVTMAISEEVVGDAQSLHPSWHWIGGFCAPADITASPRFDVSATNAIFKRSVMIEHV